MTELEEKKCNRCKKIKDIEDFINEETGKENKLCYVCRESGRDNAKEAIGIDHYKTCDNCKSEVLEMKLYDFEGNYIGICLSCRYNELELSNGLGEEPDDERAERYIEMLYQNLKRKLLHGN